MTRLIASAVIAALLLIGVIPSAQQAPEIETVQAVKSQPATVQEQTTAGSEAEALALKHAGLTADAVTGLRSEYDRDERVPHWDVEFRAGDWEYDYEINAKTGAVLKWEKEHDPAKAPSVKPSKPAVSTTTPTAPEAKELSAAEAKAIALKHAGLTSGQVRGLKAERDRERGVLEWEVEFDASGYEYSYDINANTGVIIHWEKEWDD